jgi:hypothetical protein
VPPIRQSAPHLGDLSMMKRAPFDPLNPMSLTKRNDARFYMSVCLLQGCWVGSAIGSLERYLSTCGRAIQGQEWHLLRAANIIGLTNKSDGGAIRRAMVTTNSYKLAFIAFYCGRLWKCISKGLANPFTFLPSLILQRPPSQVLCTGFTLPL